MPRSSGLDVLGVFDHVTSRGVDGAEIFRDDRGREEYLRRGTEVSRAHGVDAAEVLGPSREQRIPRARAALCRGAAAEAGQTPADLAGLTGRTQPAVWQAVHRSRGATEE